MSETTARKARLSIKAPTKEQASTRGKADKNSVQSNVSGGLQVQIKKKRNISGRTTGTITLTRKDNKTAKASPPKSVDKKRTIGKITKKSQETSGGLTTSESDKRNEALRKSKIRQEEERLKTSEKKQSTTKTKDQISTKQDPDLKDDTAITPEPDIETTDKQVPTEPKSDRPYKTNRSKTEKPQYKSRKKPFKPRDQRKTGDNEDQSSKRFRSDNKGGRTDKSTFTRDGDTRNRQNRRPPDQNESGSNRNRFSRPPEPAGGIIPDTEKPSGRKPSGPTKQKTQTNRPRNRNDRERRRSKITITSALNDDGSQSRNRSLASLRRQREKERRSGMEQEIVTEKISREVIIPDVITIQELANRMAERAVDVIKLLMKQGQMLKINDVLDSDSAQLVAEEMGHTVKRVSESDVEEGLFKTKDEEGELKQRPPVVTIMGHVDHGKTSLLDAIRASKITSGEAGGITQHIGAYQIEKSGNKITFIDTPGHAAFTQMRARGAKATDIVVLVVAADDGVMPQTKEAISHAKAAEVPIILAINKIDKERADSTRVRTELLQDEVAVESMGGDILDVEVSALKNTNLDKLLDAIQLQAEILELKANPDRAAEGIVIEAKLDKGRGPVATVLIQKGTLRIGDTVIAGSEWGRVRAMIDENGNQVTAAEPSKPVQILGFQATPEAGDLLSAVENESRAREISEYRYRKLRDAKQATGRGTFEQLMVGLKSPSGISELPIIVKGDVQGSVEAINSALDGLGTDEVKVRIIHSGVGGIKESDITLAQASNAAILGFNVRANQQARIVADTSGIELRYYNIIYDLVDDIKAILSGMLAPERRETFLGNAEILEIFKISKVGKIAGCKVTEGLVQRGAHVRLIRDDIVIHEGSLGTLKRFKDEVKEVNAGQECGMNFETYQDMQAGDIIECYNVEEIARKL